MSAKTRGTGAVYQRGATWWIVYYIRGRRIRESSRSTHRADAVRLLKRRLGEIGAGKPAGPDLERTTFEDLAAILVEDYRANQRRSLDRAQQALAHARTFFGLHRALDITADRLTAYVRFRLDEGAALATIRNELAALRRAFRLGRRAGKVGVIPDFPTLSVHNARTGFFEADQLAMVLRHLPEALRAVAQFAYLTGWRKREILGLTWASVDFGAGVLRLEPGTTKNRDGRTFPFDALPALRTLLERQRAHTDAVQRARGEIVPWVFHRLGRPIRSYDSAWRTACVKAGIPGRVVHDFRRTAVRNLERAGVPRSVAMALTGHKTETVYRRYAIVVEADLREGVAKLAAVHQQARTATVQPHFVGGAS